MPSTEIWYGALRIDQFKFFYTSPGAHTLESRGAPSPSRAVAKAIEALYQIELPPVAEGFGTMKLPTLNVGMLGGGTVVNAIPREAWFTVVSVPSTARRRTASRVLLSRPFSGLPTREKVGFRMERQLGIDYSKARPQTERLNHPLVQTTVSIVNQFRKARPPNPAARRRLERFQYSGQHGHSGCCDGRRRLAYGTPIGRVIRSEHHRSGDQITNRPGCCSDHALMAHDPARCRPPELRETSPRRNCRIRAKDHASGASSFTTCRTASVRVLPDGSEPATMSIQKTVRRLVIAAICGILATLRLVVFRDVDACMPQRFIPAILDHVTSRHRKMVRMLPVRARPRAVFKCGDEAIQ